MNGQASLHSILIDSSITTSLTDGASGIWNDMVLPVGVGAQDTTINYYIVSTIEGGIDYLDADYSVNCRAPSMKDAATLAIAVKSVVDRNATIDGMFFRVSVLPVIGPQDDTDNYNAPLDVKVWGRTFD